jgi:hypothetical protein
MQDAVGTCSRNDELPVWMVICFGRLSSHYTWIAHWAYRPSSQRNGAAEDGHLCGLQEAPIYIFVAIVPVVMDAFFKLWIFKGLNRENPAAAVTLKQMDRH